MADFISLPPSKWVREEDGYFDVRLRFKADPKAVIVWDLDRPSMWRLFYDEENSVHWDYLGEWEAIIDGDWVDEGEVQSWDNLPMKSYLNLIKAKKIIEKENIRFGPSLLWGKNM